MNVDADLFDVAAYGRPCFGERVSGDLAYWRPVEDGVVAVLLDVLGHGPAAHRVASAARGYLASAPNDPVELLTGLHEHLHASRGAAVAAAYVDASGQGRIASVGNVLVRVLGPAGNSVPGQPGVVGQRLPRLRERNVTVGEGEALLFCSDGVSSRLEVTELTRLLHSDAMEAARHTVRVFGKENDDATCLVVKRRT